MRPTAIAVFAHPDDESFGPAGTLAHLSKTHDIYLLIATDGGAGYCSVEKHEEKLSDIRKRELNAASEILGIKEVFFLGFADGSLCNNEYHNIARHIEGKLKEYRPEIVITYEHHGISGHLDHIAISFITTFVVKNLHFKPELWYYHILQEEYEAIGKNYFVHFPQGIKKEQAEKIVDISDVWEARVAALHAHASQKHDGDKIIKILQNLPKEEYFTLL